MKESAPVLLQRSVSKEQLFTGMPFRYGSRVLVLYVFSLVFKSFDLSFIQDIGFFSLRSQLFSILYVTWGLLAWEGAAWLSGRIERKTSGRTPAIRLLALSSVLLPYGGFIALGIGFAYAATDRLLFGKYEAWQSFITLSYNMNFGMYLFYLMILAFNGLVFYYKGWKEYQIKAERLMRENIQAKYDALRNQIDPHFFFNSLSVLTNLVYKNPDLSADYITQLAKTYRYILDKKFDNLVPVQTELDFLESYLFLIRIRHQSSIQFTAAIADDIRSAGMIPPATLQMLVENAIKHNRFSVNEPLSIHIKSEDGFLEIANPIRLRGDTHPSSGIGLENIRKRYELVSGKEVEITISENVFHVKIPVIASS